MVTCIIMVPLSVFFPFAYPSRPYYISRCATPTEGVAAEVLTPKLYHGGFLGWRAWVASMNPLETWKALLFGFSIALADRQRSPRENLVPSGDDEYAMEYQDVPSGGGICSRYDES
jgi:hypothetical protein